MRQDSFKLAAPAKINLYLGVHPERDGRGYHRVDTVMVALALVDEIYIEPANELAVHMDPPLDLPAEKSNVWKAAVSLAAAYGIKPRASLSIRQHIPTKAGLGGSSSDAGTTLIGLCQLWGINTRDPQVAQVARAIGADVFFFLDPRPAFLSGVGDVLEEIYPDLPPMPIVLVKPAGGVSTVEAYAGFDRWSVTSGDAPSALFTALRTGDITHIAALMTNDLDPIARRLLPAIDEVKTWLSGCPGVIGAMVSGSGSCVFGICKSSLDAKRIAAEAIKHGWWSCATQIVHT